MALRQTDAGGSGCSTGDGRAIRRSTRTSGRWLGMEDAQCDDVGGRRLALQRVHDGATEKSVVRSVVAADGSRSGGARRHGGGRGAYGTRTRRSSGERSQRGHRVRSIPVRRWSKDGQGAGAAEGVVWGRSASKRRAIGSVVGTWRGANKPLWRIFTKPAGRTCKRSRRRNSSGWSVAVRPCLVRKVTASGVTATSR